MVHTPSIVEVQKISLLPPQKGLEFPGVGGFCKLKNNNNNNNNNYY